MSGDGAIEWEMEFESSTIQCRIATPEKGTEILLALERLVLNLGWRWDGEHWVHPGELGAGPERDGAPRPLYAGPVLLPVCQGTGLSQGGDETRLAAVSP